MLSLPARADPRMAPDTAENELRGHTQFASSPLRLRWPRMSAYPTRGVVQRLADEINEGRLDATAAIDAALRRADTDEACGLLLACAVAGRPADALPRSLWCFPTSPTWGCCPFSWGRAAVIG